MSRALRRQPLVKKPPTQAPSFKPPGARPQKKQETAAAVEAKRNRTFYDKLPGAFRDIIAELRKVTWPTREETTRLGFAVIVVAVTIGLALGLVDFGFNWLVDNTLLK